MRLENGSVYETRLRCVLTFQAESVQVYGPNLSPGGGIYIYSRVRV